MLAPSDMVIMNAEDLQKTDLKKHILKSKLMKDDIKNDLMGTAYDDTKVRFNVHRRDKKDDKNTVGSCFCSASKAKLALLKLIHEDITGVKF